MASSKYILDECQKPNDIKPLQNTGSFEAETIFDLARGEWQ
jgi:hypothetical protein